MSNYFYYDYLHSKVCKVKEDQIEMDHATSLNQYLDSLCLQKGSSLKGRKDSFSRQMKIRRFVPIVIDPSHIYFPLTSAKDFHCIWVCYQEIERIEIEKKKCILHFHDGTLLTCDHPSRIIRNMQLIRQYLQML